MNVPDRVEDRDPVGVGLRCPDPTLRVDGDLRDRGVPHAPQIGRPVHGRDRWEGGRRRTVGRRRRRAGRDGDGGERLPDDRRAVPTDRGHGAGLIADEDRAPGDRDTAVRRPLEIVGPQLVAARGIHRIDPVGAARRRRRPSHRRRPATGGPLELHAPERPTRGRIDRIEQAVGAGGECDPVRDGRGARGRDPSPSTGRPGRRVEGVERPEAPGRRRSRCRRSRRRPTPSPCARPSCRPPRRPRWLAMSTATKPAPSVPA